MPSPAALTLIDKIFSYAPFNQLDRDALVERYDLSDDLALITAPLRAQAGQLPQTTNLIQAIPPSGIVINTAGSYRFAGNLTWAPASVACAAITITADNVVLDLGGFSLTATVKDSSQLIVGISVQSAANVTIRNGTLANLAYSGVSAENVSGLILTDLKVDGLVFQNLNVRNLTPTGIHINQAKNVTLTRCTVQNLNVTADASAGIQIVGAQGGTVSDCAVSNLVNNDGSVQGFSYLTSMGLTTSNCTAANFQSHFNGNILTLGHTVLGFVPILCAGLSYDTCSATRMIGCCDDCHGMSVFLDVLVTVTNFTATNVVDGVAESHSGAKATGLEVYGALVAISNCSVSDITAIQPQDKQGTGFSAWGASILFLGCTANNVSVVDANGKQSPTLGYGTGFGWAPDPRPIFRNVGAYGVEYFGCTANNCQVGFDTWFHVNSTWSFVNYTGCDIDILVQPDTATRTLTGNPCSECNPPITAVITNIARGNTYPQT